MKFLGLAAAAAAAASLVAAGGLADPHMGIKHHRGMIKRTRTAHALAAVSNAERRGPVAANNTARDADDDDDNPSPYSDWAGSNGDDDDEDSSADSDSDGESGWDAPSAPGSSTAEPQHLKNGLAWPNGPWVKIESYTKSMGWLYSWDATPATGQPHAEAFVPENISFYPMLWGNSVQRVANWKKYVLDDRNATRNRAKVAMGPNEVNQQGQAMMSPSEACELFRQYIVPLKDESGWKIIGPSTNGAASGLDWMKEFQSKCPDVWQKIDYSSVHYYGTDPKRAIAYFEKWYQEFKQPIYITETACQNYDGTAPPTLDQAHNFVKEVNDWAQKTPYISGIAFYAVMKSLNINSVNRLATSSGTPSDLFNFWVDHSPTQLNATVNGTYTTAS